MQFSEFYKTFAHNAPNQKIKADQFELFVKWYLKTETRWKHQIKKVWRWDEWPGRYGPDCGIDLVAETYDGKLVAIQAKIYNPDYQINKGDIDSFLSESARAIFDYRILIATTNKINSKARKTMEEQEKPVVTILLKDFEESVLDWPESPDALLPQKPKKKTLRPHQKKAVKKVLKGFETNDRGKLIAPVRTGKTIMSIFIDYYLKNKVTLVVAPSLLLLKQIIKEWVDNHPEAFAFGVLCSEKDIANRENEWGVSKFELGTPFVSTNPQDFVTFIQNNLHHKTIIFATYQSLDVLAQAQKKYPFDIDCALFDEAHRTVGVGKGSTFALGLNDKKLHIKKRLFMTATPKVVNHSVKEIAKSRKHEVSSMDDEFLYGPIFSEMTFKEAIDLGILCDFDIKICVVTNNQVQDLIRDNEFVTFDSGENYMDAQALALQVAVIKTMKELGVKKHISFHNTVKKASKFSNSINSTLAWMPENQRPSNEIWVGHVNGTMLSTERDLVMDSFKTTDEFALLSNARCLTEGIDIPNVDSAIFVDPRYSKSDILQAAGRPLTKIEGKDKGYVILPINIDDDIDLNDEKIREKIFTSVFSDIYGVLEALQSYDGNFEDEFNEARIGLGYRGKVMNTKFLRRLHIDAPAHISNEFYDAIITHLIRHTTEDFMEHYGKLLAHLEKTDGIYPSQGSDDSEEKFLATWIGNLRQRYKRGLLTENKINLMQKLPNWAWARSKSEIWMENGIKAREWVVAHEQYPSSESSNRFEKSAAGWITRARFDYNRDFLSNNQIEFCETFPNWIWNPKKNKWLTSGEEAKNFVIITGRYPMQRVKVEAKHYNWILRAKQLYRDGLLTKNQIKFCETFPNWHWNARGKEWIDSGNLAKQWAIKNKRYPNKRAKDSDEAKHGRWINNAKQLHKNKKLSRDRIQFCESFPDWVW